MTHIERIAKGIVKVSTIVSKEIEKNAIEEGFSPQEAFALSLGFRAALSGRLLKQVEDTLDEARLRIKAMKEMR